MGLGLAGVVEMEGVLLKNAAAALEVEEGFEELVGICAEVGNKSEFGGARSNGQPVPPFIVTPNAWVDVGLGRPFGRDVCRCKRCG